MSVELRTNLVEGSDHPRFEVVGVEAVEEQQARNQLVPSGLLQDRAAWRAGRGDVADEVGQGLTLEFEQGLDNLAGSLLREPGSAKRSISSISVSIRPIRLRKSWSVGFTTRSLRSMGAEHGGVVDLQDLTIPHEHVNAARQTGIEAADRPHDVDPLNLSGPFSSKIGVFWTASS